MVVVPGEVLVMCHMAKDPVAVALVLTSPVDHNFPSCGDRFPSRPRMGGVFPNTFYGQMPHHYIILSILTPVMCHLLTPCFFIDVGWRPRDI
jgi:hypothetical protein